MSASPGVCSSSWFGSLRNRTSRYDWTWCPSLSEDDGVNRLPSCLSTVPFHQILFHKARIFPKNEIFSKRLGNPGSFISPLVLSLRSLLLSLRSLRPLRFYRLIAALP